MCGVLSERITVLQAKTSSAVVQNSASEKFRRASFSGSRAIRTGQVEAGFREGQAFWRVDCRRNIKGMSLHALLKVALTPVAQQGTRNRPSPGHTRKQQLPKCQRAQRENDDGCVERGSSSCPQRFEIELATPAPKNGENTQASKSNSRTRER
jgi:hypothetical protein